MSLRTYALAALLALAAADAVAQAPAPRLVGTPGRMYFAAQGPGGGPDSLWFGWSWPEADSLSASLFNRPPQGVLTPFTGSEAPAPRRAEEAGFPDVAVGPQGELWLLEGGDAARWLDLMDAAEAALRRGGQALDETQLLGVNKVGWFGQCMIYSAPPLVPLRTDTGQVRVPTSLAQRAGAATALPAGMTSGTEIMAPRYSRWLVTDDGKVCIPQPGAILRLLPASGVDTTRYFLTLTDVEVRRANPVEGPWPNWVPGVRREMTGTGPFGEQIEISAADLANPDADAAEVELCAVAALRSACIWDRAVRRGVYTFADTVGSRARRLGSAVRIGCATLIPGGSCGAVGDRDWTTRQEPKVAWEYSGVFILSAAPRIASNMRGDSVSWTLASALADSLPGTMLPLVLGADTVDVVVGERPAGRWWVKWLILLLAAAVLGGAILYRLRQDAGHDLRSRLYRALDIDVRSTAAHLAGRTRLHPLDVVAFGWALRDPSVLGNPMRAARRAVRLPRKGGIDARLQADKEVAKRFDQLLRFEEVPGQPTREVWGASPPFLVLGGLHLGAPTAPPQGKKKQMQPSFRQEVADAAGSAAGRARRSRWAERQKGRGARWAAHLALGAELAKVDADDRVLRAVLASAMVSKPVTDYLRKLEALSADLRSSPAVWMRMGQHLYRTMAGGQLRGDQSSEGTGSGEQLDSLRGDVRREPWLAMLLGIWWERADEPAREQEGTLHQFALALRKTEIGDPSLPSAPKEEMSRPEAALLLGWWLARQPGVPTGEPPVVEQPVIEAEPPSPTENTAASGAFTPPRLEESPQLGGTSGTKTENLSPDKFGDLIMAQLAAAEASGQVPAWVGVLDQLLDRTAAAAVRRQAEDSLAVNQDAQKAADKRLKERKERLDEAGIEIVQAASEVQALVNDVDRAVGEVLDELGRLRPLIHTAVGQAAGKVVDGWREQILEAARGEAATLVQKELTPFQTRVQQILPDLASPEVERSAQLLRELHRQPGLVRDLLNLRGRLTDHTWSLLVNPVDAALAEDNREAGADAVQARFDRVVKQINSLPADGQSRVVDVLVNVDVLARWAGQLWRVLLLPEINDRVSSLSDAARTEWDESYRALLHFVVNLAGAYARLLSAVRGDPDGRAERPRLVDMEVLRGLEGGDVDITGRLRAQLVPPELLGELDRVVLAIQYLTEAFPIEQLERIQPGLGESLTSGLEDRLSRVSLSTDFHELVRTIAGPLGLEYRQVVYYQSSIDAPAFRFIDREVSRISLSQRLGYEARPASETIVVRLDRPFFYDALHKHYYAGYAHVARP